MPKQLGLSREGAAVEEKLTRMKKLATIYMPLLDEGTHVWRPVKAEHLAGSFYRILTPKPDDELWLFDPETIVRCEQKKFQDGTEGLVAVENSN